MFRRWTLVSRTLRYRVTMFDYDTYSHLYGNISKDWYNFANNKAVIWYPVFQPDRHLWNKILYLKHNILSRYTEFRCVKTFSEILPSFEVQFIKERIIFPKIMVLFDRYNGINALIDLYLCQFSHYSIGLWADYICAIGPDQACIFRNAGQI